MVSLGRGPKRKGTRAEVEAVKLLNDAGIDARRVPLSGSLGGEFVGDVTLNLPDGERLVAEVKVRKNAAGWGLILRWLEGKDLALLRDNSKTGRWVVAMPWEVFQSLITVRHKYGELRRAQDTT